MRYLIALTGIVGVAMLVIASKSNSEAVKAMEGADGRIEAVRKADVQIEVRDRQGKAVPGAKVKVEQVRHAFLFGANIFPLFEYTDPKQEAAYEAAFSGLLNYATLPFYLAQYEPKPGQTVERQTRVEKMARWCQERKIVTKGHPLVWHNVWPAWGPMDAEATRVLHEKRVKEIVGHFKGLIDRWDVVNEASQKPAVDNGLSRWLKRDGALAVVSESLGWARSAGPGAQLLYNDYNNDKVNEKLVEGLVKAGVMDAIGLQSHMHTGVWPLHEVWKVCERFGRFGKPLHFTELTILSGKLKASDDPDWEKTRPDWHSTPEGESQQADDVEKFYTLLFSHPAVEAITWWDLADGGWMGAPAGLIRKDLSPKPAYQRLQALIKGKWWTQTEVQADAQGQASLRGFLGTYRVTVKTAAGVRTKEMVLAKGKNVWKF